MSKQLTPEQRAKRNAYMREWKKSNPDKVNAQNQRWKDKNRGKVREKERGYAARAREENPERFKAARVRWETKFPGRAKESYKAWYDKNGREYFRKWMLEDRKKNPVRYMWRNSRNRAKEIGVEFALQLSDIVIPEVCPVLGIKIELGAGAGKGWKSFASPSVDRFDNTKGYTPGNIRVISWRANKIKGDSTLAEIEALVLYMRGGPT